jgi:hypothetical protein
MIDAAWRRRRWRSGHLYEAGSTQRSGAGGTAKHRRDSQRMCRGCRASRVAFENSDMQVVPGFIMTEVISNRRDISRVIRRGFEYTGETNV